MNWISTCIAACLFGMPVQAQVANTGEETFLRYCATCHGIDAGGNGPMASVLLPSPSDLTGLKAGNEGVFPMMRVISRIDGRDPMVAHGSPMPVYGEFFEGRGETIRVETGELMMTSQPIIDLVTYLEGLQK